MKKKIDRIVFTVAGIFFILLIVKDYFPDIRISNTVIITALLLCVFIGLFTYTKPAQSNQKTYLYRILLLLCFLFLITVLTLLDGESQSNIGLMNPIIWSFLAIVFYIHILNIVNTQRTAEPHTAVLFYILKQGLP
ncbi:hypothetical protein [Evansella halocellulosilytica]|uniref:hypothetical protein n=1 Tax=Evansella halocellulosilytica TaxID=2011013 RepID=UPI000BB892D6|nr:hypothetical protein [Evansella halocellulosilytica]